MSVKIGQEAPLFSLLNSAGKKIALADFRGKWVILYFYPKDDTPGCTTEACDFNSILPKLAEKAVIIGISPDKMESHAKFAKKYNLTFELLSDESKEAIKSYDVWGKKNMYGKEFEGVIRTTFLIDPNGKIAAIWPNVSVAEHAQKVQITLDELKVNYELNNNKF